MTDAEYYDSRFKFWDNVYGYRMENMKDMFYTEACYDFINKDCVVTEKCKLHTVEIPKVKADDKGFIEKYSFKVTGPGPIHALVIWIEIQFSNLHFPIKESYGPFNDRSSYYPVILYLKKPIAVKQGERIHGTFAVQKLHKNGKKFVLEKMSINHPSGANSVQFYKIDF